MAKTLGGVLIRVCGGALAVGIIGVSTVVGCASKPTPTSSAIAAERCQPESLVDVPVTMKGLRPIVVAKINGVEAHFVFDTGALWSMLSPAAAAEFKLTTRPLKLGVIGFRGVGGAHGGSRRPATATVQTLTFAGHDIDQMDFLVGSGAVLTFAGHDIDQSESLVGSGAMLADGLLGHNLIAEDPGWTTDIEYDLAHGVLRLTKPGNCGRRPLAYWASSSEHVGIVALDTPRLANPQPVGLAYVNGIKIRVGFDTGSPVSILSLAAARRVGITAETPGVQPAGTMLGIGPNGTKLWIAPITTFEIGGHEEIKDTRLLIGDLNLDGIDMLLGADFFLAHRIYVVNSQRRLYLSYNGGPIFRLRPVSAL